MAYRRTARKARSSNRRVSRSPSRSVRRRAPTRRAAGARRGTNTIRIVVEQPAANPIQRPIDLAATAAAHTPVLANGKAKF